MMRKLLIADTVASFNDSLSSLAGSEFEVRVCTDGQQALSLLRSFQPDALVIDLRLPGIDGLAVLQNANGSLPEAVIAITPCISFYVERSLAEIGVSYVLMAPVNGQIVLNHLRSILSSGQKSSKTVELLLKELGISAKTDGYQQLRIGIPLFARDPQQRLSKELYPAIAGICGCSGGELVEHSIRTAIHNAWKIRDPEVWCRCFQQCTKKPPSNKEFISTLAEMI